MSNILYKGTLSDFHVESIKTGLRDGYEHWIELWRMPEGFTQEWKDKNLVSYDQVCDGCMGETYHRKTHKYFSISNFIAFISEKEKNAFICQFRNDIRNDMPFSMSL